MKEIDDNILVRFLQGQCSDEELTEVEEWLKRSDDNARRLFVMERVYDKVYGDAMPEREVEKALESVHRKAESRRLRVVGMRRLLRYAAVALLFIVAGGCLWFLGVSSKILNHTEYILAQASSDHPRFVKLPDGTQIWINRGSSLRYPSAFEKGIREVELIGEGYFEVAKDSLKPFVVNSDMASVKVLGTVFDFKNDGQGNSAEVSLIEGSVEVNSQKSSGSIMLTPGQKVSINRATGRMTVSDVNAKLDAVWHNRLIPFENADIRQIANTLEQLYGVKIVVDQSIDRNSTYSGQIRQKESIDTVLNLLRNTLPITYSRKDGVIYFHPQE